MLRNDWYNRLIKLLTKLCPPLKVLDKASLALTVDLAIIVFVAVAHASISVPVGKHTSKSSENI
jgi:hypothetical protein